MVSTTVGETSGKDERDFRELGRGSGVDRAETVLWITPRLEEKRHPAWQE